jgi:signal transduction histidine kinase
MPRRRAAWRLRADLRGQLLVRAGAATAVAVVDADSLGRAVDEVLDNAVRFAPEGGVIVADLQDVPRRWAAAMDASGAAPSPVVRLTISDDGDGLAAAEFDRITDPFYRGKAHANVPGTGLGLSIVATLLQTFGARPEIGQADSGGLAVTLVLPAAAAAEAAAGPPTIYPSGNAAVGTPVSTPAVPGKITRSVGATDPVVFSMGMRDVRGQGLTDR